MRHLVFSSPNAAGTLRETPIPQPDPDQIQVRITATALNFADTLMIANTYQDTPDFPLIPGMEIAGVVTATGENVAQFSVGDEIAAITGHGGLADYALVDAHRAVPIPAGMDHATAAAFQITYATAHIALARRARLTNGETLVVLGAAGGAGLAAVEVGKAMGATVIAIARGLDRLETARAAGADIIIDSAQDDLTEQIASLPLFDVVYDTVGGQDGTTTARRLKPEGRHVLIGFASGDFPTLKPNHLLVKNIDVIGVNVSAYPTLNPKALTDSLTTLLQWHTEARIRPHIGHRFTLDQATEALDLLRSRKATGKIVVTP